MYVSDFASGLEVWLFRPPWCQVGIDDLAKLQPKHASGMR
jgi:hypothetical protein